MGSGLIYAAIIVMWALYFIPRWLRRHEELSESRSVEKFDRAMRVLSRREPTADQRQVVMPPRPSSATAPVVSSRTRPRPPALTRRERSLAIRRRRVLAGLVLLTLLLAVATPLSPVPWWAPVLLLLAVVGDLGHLRLQERRRVELSRTRDAVRKRTRSRLRRFDSAERIVEARRVLAEQRAAAEAARVEQEWAAHEAARLEDERLAADAMGWQPTPFPLPTYVTKPVAPRVGRPIDLTQPGKWTEAQGLGGASAPSAEEIFDQTSPAPAERVPAQATSATKASYDDYADELDAILERRAVND
ncbi:MAG: divisome protein SepX/GlpR [Actinomycetes bacterium]